MMPIPGKEINYTSVCLIFLVLVFAFPMAAESSRTTVVKNDIKCIDRIKISRDDNPWKGMTQSSRQEEMNKHIPAAEITEETSEVFPHLSAYQINSESLLAHLPQFELKINKDR